MSCYIYNNEKYTQEVLLSLLKNKGSWKYEISPNLNINGDTGQEILDELYRRQNEKGSLLTLDEIVGDELKNAYPTLSNIKVELSGQEQNTLAFYENAGIRGKRLNIAGIYGQYDQNKFGSPKSVIYHEIQHAIQDIEGFSMGGNPALFNELKNIEDKQKVASLLNKSKDRNKWGMLSPQLNVFDRSRISYLIDAVGFDKVKKFASILKTWNEEQTGYQQYLNVVGEVEARNVQTRMNMTAEQRRNTLLQETEDVAREDQIFLRDNLGISMSVIGEQGASRVQEYQNLLNQVKELENQGVDLETIEQRTGWYKNKENQWKYLSNEMINEFLNIGDYRNVTKTMEEILPKDSFILKVYPEAKNIKVEFYEGTKGTNFRANPRINGTVTTEGNQTTLHIRTDIADGKDFRRVLAHEFTHFGQRVEQFARGGNPFTILKLSIFITNSQDLQGQELVNNILNFNTNSLTEGEVKLVNQAKKALKNIKEYETILEEGYLNLQGEIDARAVELAMELKDKFGKDNNFSYINLVKALSKFENKDLVNEAISIFVDDINFSLTPQRAEKEVIDRLKQTGLAENVFEMNTQEIDAKLAELGVDAETRKQVIAYHGSPHSFERLFEQGLIQEVEC